MCKILMTVSADAEEKTEPNRVQKRRDLSFMTLRGGAANTNLIIDGGKSFAKRDKDGCFSAKIIEIDKGQPSVTGQPIN